MSRIDADEFDDEEIDVEAELETAIDDEEAYAEAETDDYDDEGNEDIRATAATLTEDEVAEADDDDYENEFAPEEGDDDSPDAELEEAEDADDSGDETDAVSEDSTEEFPATAEQPVATSSRKSKMPKTSRSDHIRAEIARRQEAGEGLRGKDIVAALAARRINVSPAQVSQILKKEGLSTGRKGRPKATAAAGEAPSRPAAKVKGRAGVIAKKPAAAKQAAPERKPALKVKPAVSGSAQLPMDQLQAANAFVKACGNSFETASQILGLAEQISQTFGR